MNAPKNVTELDRFIAAPCEEVVEAVRRAEGDFAVLGAGGKMGFHVCWMLKRALETLGRDASVRAVSRFGSVRSRDDFNRIGCDVIPADMSDPEQLAGIPLAENVFYLAGVKFGTAADPALLQKMNVTMPEMVAARFAQSKIVALSTGCVYSFVSPESGGSKESDATDPPGEYARSCLGREQAFIDAAERSATESVLIRLNYSIDLRYGVLVDLAQKVHTGRPVDVDTGYVNVIWQGDAVGQIIRSLHLASAPPTVLNITGPQTHRVRDLANAFADRFGCRVTFRGNESATAWLNNSARATKLFGAPKISTEQMIDWIADWIVRGGELLGKPTHFETRDGNY